MELCPGNDLLSGDEPFALFHENRAGESCHRHGGGGPWVVHRTEDQNMAPDQAIGVAATRRQRDKDRRHRSNHDVPAGRASVPSMQRHTVFDVGCPRWVPGAVLRDTQPSQPVVSRSSSHRRVDQPPWQDGSKGKRLESGTSSRPPDVFPAGPLAHRVEQGTFNPKVPGSSPGRPTHSKFCSVPTGISPVVSDVISWREERRGRGVVRRWVGVGRGTRRGGGA